MEKKQNNLQNYGSSRLRDDPADAEPVQPQKRRGKRKAEETDGLGKDGKMERANASSVTQGKKKKSELRLPQETAGDAEDGEIEWLEYMLKKEKNKASDEDALDDGLDGESCTSRSHLLTAVRPSWFRRFDWTWRKGLEAQ